MHAHADPLILFCLIFFCVAGSRAAALGLSVSPAAAVEGSEPTAPASMTQAAVAVPAAAVVAPAQPSPEEAAAAAALAAQQEKSAAEATAAAEASSATSSPGGGGRPGSGGSGGSRPVSPASPVAAALVMTANEDAKIKSALKAELASLHNEMHSYGEEVTQRKTARTGAKSRRWLAKDFFKKGEERNIGGRLLWPCYKTLSTSHAPLFRFCHVGACSISGDEIARLRAELVAKESSSTTIVQQVGGGDGGGSADAAAALKDEMAALHAEMAKMMAASEKVRELIKNGRSRHDACYSVGSIMNSTNLLSCSLTPP